MPEPDDKSAPPADADLEALARGVVSDLGLDWKLSGDQWERLKRRLAAAEERGRLEERLRVLAVLRAKSRDYSTVGIGVFVNVLDGAIRAIEKGEG